MSFVDKMIKLINGVLIKYGKDYVQENVNANLQCWVKNKEELVFLLRNHPKWNEEAMAVVLDVVENREIDKELVRYYRKKMIDISESLLAHEDRRRLYSAIIAATESYSKNLYEADRVEAVKASTGIHCAAGQKTSRVINRICQKFNLNKHPDFNAQFAKLSDSLNPLKQKRKALLSVHPCDFLEMSNENNSWYSCHCLSGGEYQAGTLSYMNDGVSMIFYTVDEDVEDDYYAVPKRSREVFAYHNGILLQSRLYPDSDDEGVKELYRNIVQQVIADCLDADNLWSLHRGAGAVGQYCETHINARQYRDYEYEKFHPSVSLLKSLDSISSEVIRIGFTAFCIECGRELAEDDENIQCQSCVGDYVYCHSCDTRIADDDAHYVNGHDYCDECVSWCEHCEEYTTDDLTTISCENRSEIQVCDHCCDNYFYLCSRCGEFFSAERVAEVDDQHYCQSCLDEEFSVCASCYEYVRDSDVVEHEGYSYCSDCAAEYEDEDDESDVILETQSA